MPGGWEFPKRLLLWVVAATLIACPNADGDTNDLEGRGEKISVGGERPFDAMNIFGDLGRSIELPDTEENKIWWERMARGEVGRDRFLILCALKDGNWKALGDVRDYVEFQMRKTFPAIKMQEILVIMAGRSAGSSSGRPLKRSQTGEGWLDKNREVISWGIESEWRIAPSVLPLLYFLLMGCPDDDRCR